MAGTCIHIQTCQKPQQKGKEQKGRECHRWHSPAVAQGRERQCQKQRQMVVGTVDGDGAVVEEGGSCSWLTLFFEDAAEEQWEESQNSNFCWSGAS